MGKQQAGQAEAKAKLLAAMRQRKQTKGKGSASHPEIRSGGQRTHAPLSSSQRRLWTLSQLGGAQFHIPVFLKIKAQLAGDVFEDALTSMVARHEALRTNVVSNGEGEPEQLIRAPFRVEVPKIDIRGESETAFKERLREFRDKAFDYADGPLFRAALFELGTNHYLFAFVIHHIISDGWSLDILLSELNEYCTAHVEGRAPQLQPVRYQFADWVEVEQSRRGSAAYDKQLAYWRQRLAGLKPLSLPTQHQRPARQTHNGGRVPVELDPATVMRVDALARQLGVSRFVLLLTAFQLTLSRSAGQRHVAVGTTVANRSLENTDYIVGFFANLLVLRASFRKEASFAGVVAELSRLTYEAFANADVSFDHVVEAVGPVRDASRTPLFQANFVLQNTHHVTLDAGYGERAGDSEDGWSATLYGLDTPVALYDLTLDLTDAGSRVFGNLVYNTDLYSGSAIKRISQRFLQQLQAGLANPDSDPFSMASLPSADATAIQRMANPGERRHDDTLAARFSAVASAYPDAIAVVDGTRAITYKRLEYLSNQLAHCLRERGVELETPVAACMARSLELIISLLGILKAGGMYVPLDPADPMGRLDELLRWSNASHIIGDVDSLDRLPAFALNFLDVLELEKDGFELDGYCEHFSPVSVSADSLAYVNFTSGSSGQPKGVCVTQGAVVDLVDSAEYSPVGPHTVIAHSATICFDAATFEIWSALLNAGCVCVIDKPTLLEAAKLKTAFDAHGVDVAWFSTSLFNAHIDHAANPIGRLKCAVFGGEQANPHAVAKALQRNPGTMLVNGYGPTENTTFSTTHRCSETSVAAGVVPIGNTLPACGALVLDECLAPCPVGTVGELYLIGSQLARCYQHMPALTAERFLPNPIARESGQRMYRTGDRAMLTAEGDLVCLGRTDRQVKIRGHRVEPEEIEHRLSSFAGVQDVVVTAVAGKAANELVAYVVSDDESILGSLREYAKIRMPGYMVPAHFCRIEVLPLGATGKVDIQRLNKAFEISASVEDFQEPATEMEALLKDVWQRTLGADKVSVTASFFDNGGDSLKAIQLKSSLLGRGYQFDIHELFASPTIRELSALLRPIDDAEHVEAAFDLLTHTDRDALPDDILDAYPLSHLQQGMLYHADLVEGVDVYRELISYQINMPFEKAHFATALAKLCSRHEMLRTSIDFNSFTEPLQFVHAHAEIALDYSDLRGNARETQEQHIRRDLEQEYSRPMNWSLPSLLRVIVHETTDTSFLVTYSGHHCIWDGWSEANLTTELLKIYHAERSGDPIEVPAITARYRDYVARELQALKSDEERSFWPEYLADLPRSLSPAVSDIADGSTHCYSLDIDSDATAKLRSTAKALKIGLKTIFLSAHVKALSVMTGSSDVITGVGLNARPEREGASEVFGLFVNVLPLRLDVSTGTWFDLCRTVKDGEATLMKHRHYPMFALRDITSRQLPFDVAFNYTDFYVFDDLMEADCEALIQGRGGHVQNSLPAVLDVSPRADGGVDVHLTVHRARYPQATAERWLHCLSEAISELASRPDQSHRIELLSKADLDMLADLKGAAVPTEGKGVHLRLKRLATAMPARIALSEGGNQLSFAVVDSLTDRLASVLRERGVQTEDRIAVCLGSGVDFTLACIGIMKAGAAFVPLDPKYPESRRAHMIRDSKAKHLITDASAVNVSVECVIGWAEWFEQARSHDGAYCAPVTRDNLCYIIYTSGSTGAPKGVACVHGSVNNLVSWFECTFPDSADDRLNQAFSVGFDGIVYGVFVPLAAASTIVFLEESLRTESVKLQSRWAMEGITHAIVPTSLASELIQLPGEWVQPSNLRVLGAGGAALKSCKGLPERVSLMNGYGPAESTVMAISWIGTNAEGRPPIGRPLPGVQALILDEHAHRVPVGTPGELYLSGEALARGYVWQPGKTAERFLPNPYALEPSQRMYRTGDIVRLQDNGLLEYLGRVDSQVKVNGVRVELEEVEAVIAQYGGIRDVGAVVRSGESKNLLCAFLVTEDGRIDVQDLQQFLLARLLVSMVPRRFEIVEHLPRTANGKVDRQSLAAMPLNHTGYSTAAPRNADESMVAELWEAVLGQAAGIYDNFFMVGGNSLHAIRLVNNIQKKLGWKITTRDLFAAPTIAALSNRFSSAQASERNITIMRAGNDPHAPSMFVFHALTGNTSDYAPLLHDLKFDGHVWGVQRTELATDAPVRIEAIRDLAFGYTETIRKLQPTGPYYLAGWSMGGTLAFEVARALERAELHVAYLGLIDAAAAGDTGDSLGKWLANRRHGTDLDVNALLGEEVVQTTLAEHLEGLAHFDADTRERLQQLVVANAIAYGLYEPAKANIDAYYYYAADELDGELGFARLDSWRRVLGGTLHLRSLPADHFGILRGNNATALARLMVLDMATASSVPERAIA